MMKRRPYVAGMFYESSPDRLRKQIEECFLHRIGPGKLPEKVVEHNIIGLISPHAGYMYSGPVAAHGYYILSKSKKPSTVIILGPNHSGLGAPIAVMDEGVWEMPLGDVDIDIECAKYIIDKAPIVTSDELAHRYEHSIEVQIPFLQYIYNSSFKIVPIAMLMQNFEAARILGEAIAKCAQEHDVVVIASTDFTHYEPVEKARAKDGIAIEHILKLNAKGLYDAVIENDITMCGYGPVMALIEAVKKLGCRDVKLLKYATSGDITGDYSSVVAYASLVFLKE
ncbi:MAG: hypothetical protein DRJ44_00545 [Thermoprotei archaeon]|nr:MAG: hypothetical protein DRJ44_00545 [Thermoprotei archaeon]